MILVILIYHLNHDIENTEFGKWEVFFSYFENMDVHFVPNPYIKIPRFDLSSNFLDFFDGIQDSDYIPIKFVGKFTIKLSKKEIVFSEVKKITEINQILSLFISMSISAKINYIEDIKFGEMFESS